MYTMMKLQIQFAAVEILREIRSVALSSVLILGFAILDSSGFWCSKGKSFGGS